MSKTEQDLDGSTDIALTDDDLVEIEPHDDALVESASDSVDVDEIDADIDDADVDALDADDDAADLSGIVDRDVDDGASGNGAAAPADADDVVESDDTAEVDAPTGELVDDDGTDHGGPDDDGPVDTDVDAPDETVADVESDADTDDADVTDDDDTTADHDVMIDASGEVEMVDASGDVEVDASGEMDAGDELEVVDASGEVEVDASGEIGAAENAATDDEDDDVDGSNPFEIPPIVMATEYETDEVDGHEVEAAEGRDASGGTPLAPPAVSRDILEELRQADIDGPIVEMAPQDDTTSARRRPKRPIDYDPAPVPIPLRVPRILGRKPRVRKVTRVVRHVDPWSVFKIAIIANMVLYLIVLTAGVLLWNVAYATGTIDNVERFFESFGWQSFEFNGGEIYHSAWIAGLFVALGLTGLAVLAATLFNLITDLVGGVRFTVLEEEVVESRTSPMRRFVVRRPEPEIPAVIKDPSGSIIREAVVDDTGDIAR